MTAAPLDINELAFKPVTELLQLLADRQLSPSELTQAYLDRIARYDRALNSYITVTGDRALEEARAADRAVVRGQSLGPLHGIPIAYKDQFFTRGVRTTCGSRILSEFVPDYDATVVARLTAAGAIMLGKLNLTEWAGPLTLDFPYGWPRNPWNLAHEGGGSSTGSGIATAAGLCAAAMGEDTGGSIIRPAAYNKCVGLRPSWGRVSTFGLFPVTWSQDTAGPLARSVRDVALMMNVVAGYDPKDPFSAGLPVPDYLAPLDGDIRGFRLGLVKEIIEAEHLHPEVRAGILDAAEQLRGLGAVIEEVSIPLLTISGMIIGAAGPPRAADHWHTLKERPNDFDVAVRRSFLLSGLLPNAISQRALQVRALLRDQVLEVAEEYDALIGAALNQPAPTIEEVRQPLATKSQATARLRRFPFTWAFAVAGLPVISVPAGFTSKALPFALQIAGKRFDEVSVLRVAHAYEQATPWQSMNPPLDALISA